MRNFSKKLAFVLAAAMVFTAFAPAAKADAAEKEMAMNKAAQTLYVNEGLNHKGAETLPEGLYGNVSEYDFYVKNKPDNWKTEYTFDWSSSDEDVITVGKAGLATAVAVGKAQVICVVTDKATKVETKLTADVTVKANAADVVISNADVYEDFVVSGEDRVVDLNRKMYAEGDKEGTSKRGVKVTDYTKWVAKFDGEVVDATVVAIDQATGKFTFAADAPAGEYELYCYTYQSDKYNQVTAEADPVVVTVEDAKVEIEDIDQKSIVSFDILFNNAVESLSKTDVTVNKVRLNSKGEPFNSIVRVKDVTLNKEKTVATVTLFAGMADATDYAVTVAGIEEGKTFTASLGKPESVELVAKNAAGVVLGDVLITDEGATLSHIVRDINNVDVTLANYKVTYSLVERKNALYTLTNGVLKIKKAGETAAVKATYQETEKGKVVKEVSEVFYFTAKDPDPIYVTGVTEFSLNGFPSSGNKTDLQLQDKDCVLTVKVATDDPAETKAEKYSAGATLNKVTGKPKLAFVAMNPEICNITAAGKLVPYKAGTALFYINTITKVDKKDVEETFDAIYIEVKDNSKVASFEMAKTDAFVGTKPGYDNAELKVVTYDQHGNKYGDGKPVTVKCTTEGFENLKDLVTVSIKEAEQTLTVKGSELAEKLGDKLTAGNSFTLDFKVEHVNMSIDFMVTVQKPTGDAEDDEVIVECKDTIDVLRYNDGNGANNNAEDAKTLTFTAFRMNSDVKVDIQEFEACPEDAKDYVKGTYYYKLTKNDKAVKADYITPAASGNAVTVKLSETKGTVTGSVVDTLVKYGETADGRYVFELYLCEAKEELTWITDAVCEVTMGNKGEYAIASQETDEVKVSNYVMKDDEVSTNSTDKKAIVECFKYTKNGKEFKFDFNNEDVSKRTLFDVKYDATADTGTVYVESITVYEAVTGGAYVDYVIPVNAVLKRISQ